MFHALAFGGDCDWGGAALRGAVADYMETRAWAQEGFEEEWLAEAETLRGGAWGGHTAIAAYSLMARRRVVVHKRQVLRGSYTVEVEEVTHSAVDASAAPAQHILYVGGNHYDALMHVEHAGDLEPAWPQPPPPQYVCLRERGSRSAPPSLAAAQAAPLPGEATPRRRSAGPRFAAPRPRKLRRTACGCQAPAGQEAGQKQRPTRRRHLEKSAPPPELRDDLAAELACVPVAARAAVPEHPHRRQEDLVKDSRELIGWMGVRVDRLSALNVGRTWPTPSCARSRPFRRAESAARQTRASCGRGASARLRVASGSRRQRTKRTWRSTWRTSIPQIWRPSSSTWSAAKRRTPR